MADNSSDSANLLPGIPFVESPLFLELVKANVFGQHLTAAEQLHQHGFAVVELGRERMKRMAAHIRNDLKDQFDLSRWLLETINGQHQARA